MISASSIWRPGCSAQRRSVVSAPMFSRFGSFASVQRARSVVACSAHTSIWMRLPRTAGNVIKPPSFKESSPVTPPGWPGWTLLAETEARFARSSGSSMAAPVAPRVQTRISLLEFPPSTGLSVTNTVCTPCRAAVIAAQTPAGPPPITANCVLIVCMIPPVP